MKKAKTMALAVSAMLLLTLTGCQDTSTSSVPIINIGGNGGENSNTHNSGGAESVGN